MAPPCADWGDTEAGRLWCQKTAESRALLAGVAALREWYQEAYKDGDDLWLSSGRTKSGPSWNGWARDVGAWLARTEKAPDADPDKPLAGALALTYADVRDYPSVASGRAQLEGVRSRLDRLRDQAAALGLIEGLKDKPSLLVVPAGLSLEDAAELYRKLQDRYPRTTFVRDRGLPPDAAAEIERRARANYKLLLEPAQAEVLEKLRAAPPGAGRPPDAETPERWKPVREWLKAPPELAGWRGLAVALARLADPDAGDPVDALADFLDRKSFVLEINGFRLVVSDDARDDERNVKPAPDEALKVHIAPADAADTVREFRPVGEGMRVEMQPFHEYRFTAAEPGRTIDCTSGDGLYAELPLVGGRTLRWGAAGRGCIGSRRCATSRSCWTRGRRRRAAGRSMECAWRRGPKMACRKFPT